MRRLATLLTVAFTGVLTIVGLGAVACVVAQPASASPGAHRHWVWPLSPRPDVLRPFDPPRSRWGPGHRGVDLAGTVGQRVLAIGDGTVTFAAQLAGRGVVVVRHGRLRSTYEPVTALVVRGEQVDAGQQIGLLQKVGSHCLPRACLHLGVRLGDGYLDPLTLLPAGPIRLKPLDGLPNQALSADQGGSSAAGSRAAGSTTQGSTNAGSPAGRAATARSTSSGERRSGGGRPGGGIGSQVAIGAAVATTAAGAGWTALLVRRLQARG